MVIDSSVVVAILLGEPEHTAFIEAITAYRTRIAGAATVFEASSAPDASRRNGPDGGPRLLCAGGDTAAAFEPEQRDVAIDAFRRCGKGRHSAGLNFGDCSPLLFKGNDFLPD